MNGIESGFLICWLMALGWYGDTLAAWPNPIDYIGGDIGTPCRFASNKTWGVCTRAVDCLGAIVEARDGNASIVQCSMRGVEPIVCCRYEEHEPCSEKASIVLEPPKSSRISAQCELQSYSFVCSQTGTECVFSVCALGRVRFLFHRQFSRAASFSIISAHGRVGMA